MNLNIALWFAVFIAGVAAISLAYWMNSITNSFYLFRFYAFLLRKLVYPLLWPDPRWSRITRFQAVLFGVYFAINGFCMGAGIHTASDLMSRSGLMASVNLIPLFLGGRTSMFSRVLGISLHSYYLWHHWIGRVVVVQGLLHASLILKLRSPKALLSSQLSGITSASALALILLTSIWFVRRVMYEIFLKIHFVLAMVAVVALLKHLLLFGMPRAALPIAAISLWGLNAGLRFGQMAYNNLAGPQDGEDATVKRFYSDETKKSVTAFKIHILVKRGREVGPGDYYYLSFNDMGLRRRWQAHPFVVSWWDDSMNASCLDFLVEPQAGITADLISKKCIRGVTLDGPYGKDIHLQDYETVILVARGIGIVGVLPYVRHMIYRRSSTSKNLEEYRRGLITRKIDLYWDMEDNSQQDWLEEWIKALKGRDAEKLILTFTCFYPSKKSKPPPILQESGKPPDEHWRFVYEKEALPIINDLMLKRIARSPGKTKVVVCGAASFSKDIRTYVIDAMDSYSDIEFAEVEYQPRGSHGYNIHSRVGSLKTDMDMEMGVTDEMPRQKQLLTKSNPGRTLGPSKARPTGSRNTTTRMKTVPEEEEEEEEEVSDVSSSAGAGVAGREFV